MFLQAVLSVAFIAVLAGALLTSALVDANVAAHRTASRFAIAALARGTDEFVNRAQIYVSQHGAAATWPTTPVTDQPVSTCAPTSPCATFATISYVVAGSSAAAKTGPDPAQNLQVALNENRIAGTVTVTITDATGDVESAFTRDVTVRIFDAAPFAVLTGIRDATTMAGSVTAGQGDTAGYRDTNEVSHRATPDPSKPMEAKDTSISVTMSCTNSANNSDETRAFNDDHQPGNDGKQWGISGGSAFEAPCAPTYGFAIAPSPPPDAIIPNSNIYDVGGFSNSQWTQNTQTTNGWVK